MEQNRVKITPKRYAAAAIVASLALAACGGDDDDEPAAEAPAGEEPAEEPAEEPMDEPAEEPAGDDLSGLSGSVFVSGSSTVEPISIAVGDAFADLAPASPSPSRPGHGRRVRQVLQRRERHLRRLPADQGRGSRELRGERHRVRRAQGRRRRAVGHHVGAERRRRVPLVRRPVRPARPRLCRHQQLGRCHRARRRLRRHGHRPRCGQHPVPRRPAGGHRPGEESGTFDSFVEIVIEEVGDALGAEDPNVRIDYTASPNDNVIIEGIAANPTSLGWVGFAFVEENLDVVKPLAVDGGGGCVEPTPETIASAEFPIARDLFIYVNAGKAEENPALAAYVDYYVTDRHHRARRHR
jgi:phosphate transport system substrate-binding protein